MPGIIVKDPEKIRASQILDDGKLRNDFLSAVDKFLKAGLYDETGTPIPRERGEEILKAKLQAAASYPPEAMKPPKPVVVDLDKILPEVDDRWMQIFRTVNSDSEYEEYQIGSQAVTFKELKPGETVEFTYFTKGKTVALKNLTYAAGIRLYRNWLEDNKWWKIEDAIWRAKVEAVNNKARFMWNLLKNTKYEEISFTDSWIKTLNTAWAKLRRNVGRDYLKKPIAVCAPEIAAALLQAKKDSAVAAERGERLTFDFEVIDTVHYDPTDPITLTLPKTDQYYQHRQGLRVDRDFNITTQSIDIVFTERYNGIITDTRTGIKIKLP